MDLLEQNQVQNMDGMCVPTGDCCGSVVSLGVEIPFSEHFGGNQTELFLY